MIVVRYLLFSVVGVVVAGVLFFALNAAITVTRDESDGIIERWIIRATIHQRTYLRRALGRAIQKRLRRARR